MTVNAYFILTLSCLLLGSTVKTCYGLEEGDNCTVSHISGICTLVEKCDLALSALSKGRPHHLKRCTFEDKDEIVCCPTTGIIVKEPEEVPEKTTQSTDTRLNTKRRCEKACDKISRISLSMATDHIIGGKNAEKDEFPHMAALGFPSDDDIEWNCGASIISKNFVLTAAHCFTKAIKPYKVRVGVTRLNEPNPQDFDIKNSIVHEQYNPTTRHNDIALVEVEGEIQFNSKTYPACLYSENDDPEKLIITGWGKTTTVLEDDRSIILQKATVVPYDLKKCNEIYESRSFGSKTIIKTQQCAGTAEGANQTDACWGDSGGPCQIKTNKGVFSIVSIISYGQQCGSRVPGVYTRVSSFLDWIENYVWPSI